MRYNNMRTLLILLSFILFAAAHIDQYDVLPIDMIALVKNPKELQKFMDCLLDKGKCNDVYVGYRVYTQESVRQSCKRCTVDQKRFVYLFLESLKEFLPDEYHNFRHKYDPKNKYFDALEEEVYKYKFEPCQ